MIRFLLLVLLILILTVSSALLLLEDPGYVLLSIGDSSIEMTVSMLTIILILGFAAITMIYRTLHFTISFPDRMYLWGRTHRLARAKEKTLKGMHALAEGHWKQAEKLLAQSAEDSDSPMLNYLAAARAAQHQREHERRDSYLQRASKSGKQSALATSLTQADLQISQGQNEQALASLNHLVTVEPRNPYVLEMLLYLYQQLGEWKNLKERLPDLWKLGIIDNDEAAELEIEVSIQLIHALAKREDVDSMHEQWQKMPKDIKSNPEVVEEVASIFIDLDQGDDAEKILRESLKRSWHKNLIYLYGKVKASDPAAQLKYAQTWAKDHNNDAVVHLSLGRICNLNNLPDEAKVHFEKSIELGARAETYFELGQLLEQGQDSGAAMEQYRSGLELVVG